MLPIMAGVVTTRSPQWAWVLIAGCIIVPQAVVAWVSPTVGAKAQAWGRRPLLMIGFGGPVVPGLLVSAVRDPHIVGARPIFGGHNAPRFRRLGPPVCPDV